MSALGITITLSGASEVEMTMQAMRNALARRGPMHARMAVRGQQFTQDYLRKLNRHRSAERLGAKPTGHHQKAAAAVESSHDEESAMITIPRRTGLGRAFGDVLLRPGSGKKYLTIPAHKRTYGRSARDDRWGADPFQYVMLGRYRALIFKDGPDKGEVAYWLKREVTQKQDRTLLPSDEGYAEVARRSAIVYLKNLSTGGPIGGTPSGMPSAFPS